MNTTSVPKILLGLGAFCLLVAAAIFLAVSWSTLGVGGRTAVLATLTLAALASTVALHRHGLRIAAESISVVTLGLLALDVYGAGAAGLLGAADGATVTLLAGAVLAAGAAAFGLTTAGALPRLAAPQVAVGVGLALAFLGAANGDPGHPILAGHLVVLIAAAGAWLSRRAGLPVQQWSCLGAGALAWAGATLTATLDALGDPSVHQLWVDGSGWALLISAIGVLLPGLILRNEDAFLTGATGAALLVTATATLPATDSSGTTFVAVALGVTAAWTAFFGLVRSRLRQVAVAPAGIGCLILGASVLLVAGIDLLHWSRIAQPFGHDLLVRPEGHFHPVAPALVVPALLLLGLVVALLAARRARPDLRPLAGAAALVTGGAAALATAGYDLPLAVTTGTLALTGALAAALAARSERAEAPAYAVVSIAALAAGVIGSLPSAGLTAAVAGAGLLTAGAMALLARTDDVRVAGEVALVPAAAFTVIGLVEQLAHRDAWLAVPVLLAVGLLAVARPRVWVELPAAVLAIAVLPVSLLAAAEPLAVLALWLLTAGALCSASALMHPSRRPLAVAGSVLMLLAVWARLADQHVSIPEAYTLPLAAALLAVGLVQLRRRPETTSLQALMPGLALALLPSLVLCLGDPASLRALLLGAGCLVLVLGGAVARWSAPVITGAATGAILVLRELGPYAHVVPQWIWIGLAGVLLTVAGITWERQLRDLRAAVGMIGRLR